MSVPADEALTPQELLDYLHDRLTPECRADVESRLKSQPDARQALRDLEDFPDVQPAAGARELSDNDVRNAWNRFRDRLGDRDEQDR